MNKNNTKYIPLVDKYVPDDYSCIIGKKYNIYGKEINIEGNTNKKYFHENLLKDLLKISKDDEFPNIIFYGKPGTGKKIILNLFLEMIYGKSIYNMDDVTYNVPSSGNTDKDVIVKQSDHHIVIEPNNNNFDRYLVRHIIVEYSKRKPLNIFEGKKQKQFKVVQINNLEELSEKAQTSLRRTIEKYSKTCRFVMWTRSLSKVIKPLRSRCPCFHVPTIENTELIKWAYRVSRENGIKISLLKLHQIVESSNGNLKTILWKMDLYKYTGKIINTYEEKIINLSQKILLGNENIQVIRLMIQEFLTTNIKSNKIIIDIMNYIFKTQKLSDHKTNQIIENVSNYYNRLMLSRRDIIHIENFVVKIINIVKQRD